MMRSQADAGLLAITDLAIGDVHSTVDRSPLRQAAAEAWPLSALLHCWVAATVVTAPQMSESAPDVLVKVCIQGLRAVAMHHQKENGSMRTSFSHLHLHRMNQLHHSAYENCWQRVR